MINNKDIPININKNYLKSITTIQHSIKIIKDKEIEKEIEMIIMDKTWRD